VNEYLRDRGGPEISAKDFRTWGASVIVTGALASTAPPADEKEAATAMAEAERLASEALGNTVAVARSAYIHPGLAADHLSGALHRQWADSRKSARLSRPEHCFLQWLT
jgi:DNA topoisomerase-1